MKTDHFFCCFLKHKENDPHRSQRSLSKCTNIRYTQKTHKCDCLENTLDIAEHLKWTPCRNDQRKREVQMPFQEQGVGAGGRGRREIDINARLGDQSHYSSISRTHAQRQERNGKAHLYIIPPLPSQPKFSKKTRNSCCSQWCCNFQKGPECHWRLI